MQKSGPDIAPRALTCRGLAIEDEARWQILCWVKATNMETSHCSLSRGEWVQSNILPLSSVIPAERKLILNWNGCSDSPDVSCPRTDSTSTSGMTNFSDATPGVGPADTEITPGGGEKRCNDDKPEAGTQFKRQVTEKQDQQGQLTKS